MNWPIVFIGALSVRARAIDFYNLMGNISIWWRYLARKKEKKSPSKGAGLPTPESTDSDTLIRINYHFSSIVLFEHYQMVDGHHTDAVKIRIYSHYITVLEAFLAASMCCHLDESREASSHGIRRKISIIRIFWNWKKLEETGRNGKNWDEGEEDGYDWRAGGVAYQSSLNFDTLTMQQPCVNHDHSL